MKLLIENIPYVFTDFDLKELFCSVGEVINATVITDWDTGKSRGMGTVEMSDESGELAMVRLNGHEIDFRTLRIYKTH